ncbi:conserved domain protein [delta proteobacterium NaphS2]|nr:conserved domain protein [delta proteobacterium NaphS2]
MKCICSKCLILGIGAIVALALFLGSSGICRAEGEALEQLLDLLRQNGAITNEQAEKIEATLTKDQKAMAEREQALEERERALEKREEALKVREQTVSSDQEGITQKPAEASLPSELKPSEAHKDVKAAKVESEPVADKDLQKRKEFPLEAVFDDGFYLRSREKDLFELRVGGLLQVDYRYFNYEGNADPDNNKFDIRRSRLLLAGRLYERFSYKFQYEFQGAGSRKLLDAYGNALVLPYLQLRAGQFKEPFSLEQYTPDAIFPFPSEHGYI